jgi:hypothetical protein
MNYKNHLLVDDVKMFFFTTMTYIIIHVFRPEYFLTIFTFPEGFSPLFLGSLYQVMTGNEGIRPAKQPPVQRAKQLWVPDYFMRVPPEKGGEIHLDFR